MHGGTHSCKIYKPLPQQGLINRLSGIKSSNPFDTDSICDYASQAMLKEHGQPRPCSFKFVRLYVNSWDRGKRKNVVAVADGLFCREIDGLFCRSSPDIIVRRRCVLSHKRRGWLQPSPSFRYSRNLALQDELYHPVINNGPAVLVCVDKRLGTGPVNQSRDAG